MKALVPAGGAGTRLRPITYTSAKQLLPVANKPILFHVLDAIRDSGITDVAVVVGDTAPQIQAEVRDGSSFGLGVTYIKQEVPHGLAHAVLLSRDYLGDDDFVMYRGDNFIAGGIASIVATFSSSRPDAQILLARVPDPRSFCVAELGDGGEVIRVEEKRSKPKSDLALVGVYVFTSVVHEAIRQLKPSSRGELKISDAIARLIGSGHRVSSAVISDRWKDTGNVAGMLEVNRMALEAIEPALAGTVDKASELIGRVAIREGAEVSRSRVVGPAIVGAGSRVIDSYVGPFTSVAEGCTIEDSEIEYSIMLCGASVRGVRRIEASLFGRDVTVTPATRAPRTHRLVLGDHSRVQINA